MADRYRIREHVIADVVNRHRAVQEEERGEVIVENDIGKLPLVLNAEFRINISRNSNIDSEDNLAIPLADTHVGLTPVTQSTLTRPVLDGDILTPASIPSPALSIPKRKFSSDNGRKILEMNVKKVMEMFPRVDVDWIRHEVQKSEAVLERVIQYILDNEHTDKVPKQSRKRPFEIAMSTARRASILVQNDNTKTVRLQREDCPPGMHSIINKIALMSQEEKLMHCAMVDALFNRLVEPSKDVILRVDKTSEDSIIIRYPMVRVWAVRNILETKTPISALIILELLKINEENRLFMSGVLEQDVLKGRNSRPLTKNPNISQTRRDTERSHPFANRSFQRAWKAVQNIINANYRDKVEMFHCKVCFDDFIISTAICCRSANEKSDIHKFCAGCVTGMAKASTGDTAVAVGGVGLTCLEAGCEGHIAWAHVRPLLDEQTLYQLEKRLEQEALNASDLDVERCKYCSFGVIFDVPKDTDKVFKCSMCSAEFCRLCSNDWEFHIGKRCDEMQTEAEKKRKELEEELTKAVIRTCPRCKIAFEKKEGCNKMTCRCGVTQCYVCRTSKIGYDHFCEHMRDPKRPDKCPENCSKPCLLWVDVTTSNNNQRRRILEEANLDGNVLRALI